MSIKMMHKYSQIFLLFKNAKTTISFANKLYLQCNVILYVEKLPTLFTIFPFYFFIHYRFILFSDLLK